VLLYHGLPIEAIAAIAAIASIQFAPEKTISYYDNVDGRCLRLSFCYQFAELLRNRLIPNPDFGSDLANRSYHFKKAGA
jgi:hypothetical protein